MSFQFAMVDFEKDQVEIQDLDPQKDRRLLKVDLFLSDESVQILKSHFQGKGFWQGTVSWKFADHLQETQTIGYKLGSGVILLMSDNLQEQAEGRKRLGRMAQLVSVGEVASGIAHEINTPLSVLSGRLALIKRAVQKAPVDVEKIKADCEAGETVVSRIGHMVKGIRNLSKAGDEDPFVKTDMLTIVENLRSITEDKAVRMNVQLTFEGGAVSLQCREVQIAQVLLNLVNNAFDSLEDKPEKWINVSWLVQDQDLEIKVTDSGPRVSDELAAKILQPYFTTKAPGRGTGLGLSLSQKIIHDHRGTFKLNKEMEKMEFVIRLPLSQKAT